MPEDKDRTPNDAIVDAMNQIGLTPSARGGARPKVPADRVLELFQAALQQGLVSKKSSSDGHPPAPPTDNIGEGDEFEAHLERGTAGEESIEPDAAAPRKVRKLSDWEEGLQGKARDAFNDYILQNVSKDAPAGSEISVDAGFLKDHGAALMGSVLQALVKSVVPPEMNVEIPSKKSPVAPVEGSGDAAPDPATAVAEPGGAESQVKLKVDFAKILADLVANARVKKNQNPA